MLHLILKTYKTAIIVNLSPHQQSPESLVPWGRLLFRVVGMAVPAEGVPTDEEDRERCEWWKAKKWAYGILGRLFHRCVSSSHILCVSESIVALEIPLSFRHQCRKSMVYLLRTL
jgi:hypothetical protein